LSVAWTSSEELHVRAPPARVHVPSDPGVFTTNIYWKEERWSDVHITYEFDLSPVPKGSAD
jgi:hypothetical protein